jgi:hypothetical protein
LKKGKTGFTLVNCGYCTKEGILPDSVSKQGGVLCLFLWFILPVPDVNPYMGKSEDSIYRR